MSEMHGGRRWGLYLIGVGILLVCALFLAHLVWSAGAGKALNRQVAAIKAAGEPIELADYKVAVVLADEDNGAIDLRDAFKSLQMKTPAWEKFYNKETLDLPLIEREMKAIQGVLAENAKALELVDEARKRKGVDWRIALTSPSIHILLPHLSEVRQLAYLISARAKLKFMEGDHAAAVEDMERLRFLSDAAGKPPTVLVTHLVSVGITGLQTDCLQKMAPTLKIGSEPGAASKEQVAKLIAELVDDKAQRENMIASFQFERTFQLDAVRCLADGTLNLMALSGSYGRTGTQPSGVASALNFAAKPIALEDGGIMLRYSTQLLEAIRKSEDLPTFKSIQPPLPPQINNARHLVLRMLLPSLERAVETDFRSSNERRAAAVSLACRLYALDHGGAMPAAIEDLVPKYLPSAPLDAFAQARPLKYIGPATTRPVVYSIGTNGKDDGGSEASIYPARPASSKWDRLDIVTHLTPQPRESPPAEESVDDGTEIDGDAASIYPPETMERVRQATTQAAAERGIPATTQSAP